MHQIDVLYTIQKLIVLIHFILMHASKNKFRIIAITYIIQRIFEISRCPSSLSENLNTYRTFFRF